MDDQESHERSAAQGGALAGPRPRSCGQERGDRQAVLTELATVAVEMARVRAALAIARNADLPEFARFFGCPAEFGRAVDQGAALLMLEFSNAAVTAPLLTADPTLLKTLEPFATWRRRRAGPHRIPLRAAVEKEVEKLLPYSKAQKANRSKSARHKHPNACAPASCPGNNIRGGRRPVGWCGLALQYLKDPGMSLSQIVWQLGYEQSTSFNHAFRRWTGRSPSEVRKRKSLPAAA